MRPYRFVAAVLLLIAAAATTAFAQAPVAYRLTFPEPEHQWMQVEVTFPDLPAGPFELHMSPSSPGRYALHEFAKNVYDVRISDTTGAAPRGTRPKPYQWGIAQHPPTLRVSHRGFGETHHGT